SRVPSNHFGPLLPFGRTTTREKESEQVGRTIAPTEANEGGHVAQFVGRVIVPVAAPVAPVLEFAPIAIVSRVNHRLREILRTAVRREGNARRRRIEITQ